MGKVGRLKYHVSSTRTVKRVVGPMMMLCRMRWGERLWGRRRRKVIKEVGRNKTASDAKNSDRDTRLWSEEVSHWKRLGRRRVQ